MQKGKGFTISVGKFSFTVPKITNTLPLTVLGNKTPQESQQRKQNFNRWVGRFEVKAFNEKQAENSSKLAVPICREWKLRCTIEGVITKKMSEAFYLRKKLWAGHFGNSWNLWYLLKNVLHKGPSKFPKKNWLPGPKNWLKKLFSVCE